MIVADTDVLIDTLWGREPARSRVVAAIEGGALATTAITVFELMSGARRGRASAAVEDLLGAVLVLPVDERAGKEAAACRTQLEAAGRTIGMADLLIAGVCLSRSLALLTRNRQHFERVPGLLLVPLVEA